MKSLIDYLNKSIIPKDYVIQSNNIINKELLKKFWNIEVQQTDENLSYEAN